MIDAHTVKVAGPLGVAGPPRRFRPMQEQETPAVTRVVGMGVRGVGPTSCVGTFVPVHP